MKVGGADPAGAAADEEAVRAGGEAADVERTVAVRLAPARHERAVRRVRPYTATGDPAAVAVDDAAGDRAAGDERARDPRGDLAAAELHRGRAVHTGLLGLVAVEARRETRLAGESVEGELVGAVGQVAEPVGPVGRGHPLVDRHARLGQELNRDRTVDPRDLAADGALGSELDVGVRGRLAGDRLDVDPGFRRRAAHALGGNTGKNSKS